MIMTPEERRQLAIKVLRKADALNIRTYTETRVDAMTDDELERAMELLQIESRRRSQSR